MHRHQVNERAPVSKEKFTNSTIMKSSFVGLSVSAAFGFSVGELPFWSSRSIVLEQSSSSFEGGEESWWGRSDMISLLKGTSGIMISGSMFFLFASAKAPNFTVSFREVFLSSLKAVVKRLQIKRQGRNYFLVNYSASLVSKVNKQFKVWKIISLWESHEVLTRFLCDRPMPWLIAFDKSTLVWSMLKLFRATFSEKVSSWYRYRFKSDISSTLISRFCNFHFSIRISLM